MKNLLTLTFVVTLMFACTQKNDSPVINSITLTSSNIQKADGAFLEFIYEFSDDNGLNQFRVSVIDDFEDARLSSAPWNYDKDYDLSGTSVSDSLSLGLPYPDLEPGRYKLTIIVQDIDGEETAESKTFNVVQP